MSVPGSSQGSGEDSRALAFPPQEAGWQCRAEATLSGVQGHLLPLDAMTGNKLPHLSLGLRFPNCKVWATMIILFEGCIPEDPECFKNSHLKSHLPAGLTKKGEGTSVGDVVISKKCTYGFHSFSAQNS